MINGQSLGRFDYNNNTFAELFKLLYIYKFIHQIHFCEKIQIENVKNLKR